jgi:hypothetical protein
VYSDYAVWMIDVEFCAVALIQLIAYTIAIRKLKTDRIVISTNIKYGAMS